MLGGVVPGGWRMNAGNERADHADIGGPQFPGGDIHHGSSGNEKVEGQLSASGLYGPVTEPGNVEVTWFLHVNEFRSLRSGARRPRERCSRAYTHQYDVISS